MSVNLQQNSQLRETAVSSSCAQFDCHATFHAKLCGFFFSTFHFHFPFLRKHFRQLFPQLSAQTFPVCISSVNISATNSIQHSSNIFKIAFKFQFFIFPLSREEGLNLKGKVLRKSAITTNVPRLQEVANFGTNYFLLKIKILAKRKREFTTKFAIARNRC